MVEKLKLIKKSLRQYPIAKEWLNNSCLEIKKDYEGCLAIQKKLRVEIDLKLKRELKEEFNASWIKLKRNYNRLAIVEKCLRNRADKLQKNHLNCCVRKIKDQLFEIWNDYSNLDRKIFSFVFLSQRLFNSKRS